MPKHTTEGLRKQQKPNDNWIAEYIYMAANLRASGIKYSEMLEEIIQKAKERYSKEVATVGVMAHAKDVETIVTAQQLALLDRVEKEVIGEDEMVIDDDDIAEMPKRVHSHERRENELKKVHNKLRDECRQSIAALRSEIKGENRE